LIPKWALYFGLCTCNESSELSFTRSKTKVQSPKTKARFFMFRIAILTPSLTTGDAVGNDVFGMYDVLSARGYDIRIYADGWESVGEHRIWHAEEFADFL